MIAEPKCRPRDTGNRPRSHGDYEAEWARCTREARELYESVVRNKMEVARLALSVCVVNHGGGGHWSDFKGVKTLTQFAKEIGMSYKTLNSWCCVYRQVYLKVPETVWEPAKWKAATQALKRVRGVRVADFETVTEIYRDELRKPADRSRIELVNKYLGTILNHIEKIDWDEVEEHEIQQSNELISRLVEVWVDEEED